MKRHHGSQGLLTPPATANAELPPGWRWVRLGDVCRIIPGRHIVEANHNRERRGIPYLTGPSDFGGLQASASRWTEKPDVMCQPRDVLVTVKGAGVAKINFAPDLPTCIGRQLMAVRAIEGVTDSEFLFLAIEVRKETLKQRAMGATVPGLSIEHLESLPIPLPPIAVQQRLAVILREQMAAVERARAAAQAQLEAINRLPGALLGRAFRGEL